MSRSATETSASRPTAIARRLRYLAPCLLLAVAAVQIPLAKAWLLTAWKGGGFGMFSTLDSASFRPVRAYAYGDGFDRRLEIPQPLAGPTVAAACLPTERRLVDLARRLAPIVQRAEPKARGVRVEVWKTEFDGATSTLRVYLWRSAHWEFPDAGR